MNSVVKVPLPLLILFGPALIVGWVIVVALRALAGLGQQR